MNGIIPKQVKLEAKNLINLYGESIGFLGEYNGYEVYFFQFPENELTGFPFVFLYDREEDCADTITGFDALNIIDFFTKQEYKDKPL